MNAVQRGPRPGRILGVVALACLALQFPGSLVWSGLALGAWLVATACLDRASLRRMWMPRFWAVTLLLALATGVLLGQKEATGSGALVSWQGLEAGALLVVRGALIFGLTSWASHAIPGPRLLRILARVGLASLGRAASVALSTVPHLQQRLVAMWQDGERSRDRGHIGRIKEFAVLAFCETVRLAQGLAADRARVAAILGSPGVGKTSTLLQVAERLREAGLQVGGVAQPALYRDGARVGYELLDLATGEKRPFATLTSQGGIDGTRFAFDEAGWVWAAERIRAAMRTADVVAVDEVGRIEAKGDGHMRALLGPATFGRARWWLLAVRSDCADAIQEQVGEFAVRVTLDAMPQTNGLVARIVTEVCNSYSRREPT